MKPATVLGGEVEHLDVTGLVHVGVRPSISSYLKEMWQLRHFIREEAKGQAFQKSKGMILGRIWLLLEPFFNASIYLVMFGLVLKTGRGIDNILGYVMIGSILFSYFQVSLGPAASIITQGYGLIKSFTFPRASLVLSFALRNLYNALPTFVLMAIMIMVMPTHALPSVHWLLVSAAIALQAIFNLGLSFFVASITRRIPDFVFVWSLISSLWFFASGVFFSVNRWVTQPFIAAAMEANPAYVLLTICRDLMLYQTWPDLSMWLYFGAWAFGLLFVGFVLFWQNEESYGTLPAR